MNRPIILIVLSFFLLTACFSNKAETDSKNSIYYIDNKGSDTIVNLALAWAEKYQSEHTDVSVAVTGGGSGTGIAALINKTTNIANASRQIKKEEIAEAKKNGVDPVEHTIARDAIAVIVNPNNPVSRLTMQQISQATWAAPTNKVSFADGGLFGRFINSLAGNSGPSFPVARHWIRKLKSSGEDLDSEFCKDMA